MKEKYVILRESSVRPRGPVAGPAGGTSTQASLEVEVDELDRRASRAVAAKKDVKAVAPVIPMRLITPIPQPEDNAQPAAGTAWGITAVKADQSPFDGTDVIVAVLDTGIVSAHPEFAGRFVNGYDMISSADAARDGDGRDPDPEDEGDLETPQGSSFHGTHVAGTIGANGNDNVGVAGVDWNCKLMIVRVLGRGGGSVDDIANGILFAARLTNGSGQLPTQRADIVNMSLGGPGINSVLQAACDAAANAGVLLIAAAGNDDSSQPGSPAAFSSVVSVGAVDLIRQRAPYSNFSSTIDVWAPGGDMTADRNGDTYPDGVLSCMADDQGDLFYQFENGTSMAAPHVAGIAALVKAANPSLTAWQIRTLLTASSTTQAGVDLPNNGRIVDALAAVQAAGGGNNVPLLVATPSAVDFGRTATVLTVLLENRGSGNLVFNGISYSPAAPWLSESLSDQIPSNGIVEDELVFTVDRTLLPDDVYQTRATLTFLDGATPVLVDVEVRMQVGASGTLGDTMFVLLVDPITLETRYQTSTDAGDGFDFTMGTIAPGDYLLVAGTDRDDDGFLGDDGELFGAWPDLDDVLEITLAAGENASGLEFSMQELVSVTAAAAQPARTFRRLR
jgi:serine protease